MLTSYRVYLNFFIWNEANRSGFLHFILKKEDMMKKIVATAMAAAFLFSGGVVFAAKCSVDTIEDKTVTMTCDEIDMKVGDNVNVRVERKRKGLEGC